VKTERVTVASLLFDSANVRKHGERNLDAIKASLARFGQQKPIVVDGDGIVRAGNGTLMAAKALGWDEIEIVRTNLRGSEATAYAIADNRTAELAEWDEAALAEQLAALQIDDEALAAATGFDASEIEQMALPVDVVEDDVPEVPVDPITKPGDLWLLGEHRVLCGDSLDLSDRERLMCGEKIALVATDPPYAIFGSSTGIAKDIADDKMVRPFFEAIGRACTASLPYFGHAYVCCDWRSWSAVTHGMKAAGMTIKNCIVWDKGDFGLGNMYRQCHEFIGLFAFDPVQDSHYAQKKTGSIQVLEPNIRRQNRTGQGGFESEQEHGERFHNAAKPVELMAWLIQNSTKTTETVLDLFLGSGTTLIAAEQTGRKCYGMEISPAYCDVIVKRWETLTGKKATLAS
jgi:DNA modification methylase